MDNNISSLISTKSDHITPLGFKNDGYDYSKHLKVMGMYIAGYIFVL